MCDDQNIPKFYLEGHLGKYEIVGPALAVLLNTITHAYTTVSDDAECAVQDALDFLKAHGPRKGHAVRGLIAALTEAQEVIVHMSDAIHDLLLVVEVGVEEFVDNLADPDLADDEELTDEEFAVAEAARHADAKALIEQADREYRAAHDGKSRTEVAAATADADKGRAAELRARFNLK